MSAAREHLPNRRANISFPFEIVGPLAESIASWHRVFCGRNGADPRDLLRKAAADLWQTLEIDRTVHPETCLIKRQAVVDALQEMADGAGIGPDDAQLIFAQSFRRKQEEAKPPTEKITSLISRSAANIPPEKVDWLWHGRLARGKHTCFAGEPGTGKSQTSISITATITTAGLWPCGEGVAPLGNVIILSAEDGAADTIVPRLIAAGADCNRVHIVSAVRNLDGKGQRAFNLQTDIELLERKITEIGDIALVIIDPVSSYMGKTDSHKNSEVRGVLEPLSDMADRTRVALLSITHFNKTGANGTTKAMHRFIGSIAFTGAPRTAFACIEDPEDASRRLFLHAKNNLAAPPQGLAFRLEQTIVANGIVASRVAWESEPVTITANEALAAEAAGGDQRTARADAEEFLSAILVSGPMAQKEIKEAVEGAGLAWATVRRAKDRLGIKPHKSGMDGPWVWALPKMLISPEDAHVLNVSTFGLDEHLRQDGGGGGRT
jgi:putative DNA primase/helicase